MVVATHLEVLVASGLAQPLHAEQTGLQAGRLVSVGPPDVGATVEMHDRGRLLGPLSRQGLDGPLGYGCLARGPFGSLGHAVFSPQHIVLEFVEAHHVSGNVVFVVRALRHPHVGDGQVHGGIGVGKDGDPFAGMDRARVVEIGRDEDLLLTQLLPVEEYVAGELAGESPGSGLQVCADVEDHVGVLGDIVHHVVGGKT